jgi:hypothetical protein
LEDACAVGYIEWDGESKGIARAIITAIDRTCNKRFVLSKSNLLQ